MACVCVCMRAFPCSTSFQHLVGKVVPCSILYPFWGGGGALAAMPPLPIHRAQLILLPLGVAVYAHTCQKN